MPTPCRPRPVAPPPDGFLALRSHCRSCFALSTPYSPSNLSCSAPSRCGPGWLPAPPARRCPQLHHSLRAGCAALRAALLLHRDRLQRCHAGQEYAAALWAPPIRPGARALTHPRLARHPPPPTRPMAPLHDGFAALRSPCPSRFAPSHRIRPRCRHARARSQRRPSRDADAAGRKGSDAPSTHPPSFPPTHPAARSAAALPHCARPRLRFARRHLLCRAAATPYCGIRVRSRPIHSLRASSCCSQFWPKVPAVTCPRLSALRRKSTRAQDIRSTARELPDRLRRKDVAGSLKRLFEEIRIKDEASVADKLFTISTLSMTSHSTT